MNNTEQFQSLVSDAQRPEDGYVNATKWCKAFGYDVYEWKRLPDTKRRAKALQDKTSSGNGVKIPVINSVGRGRGARTWVHPIMAIHLAQYLSPEFANFVAEIFKRYLEADPTLAANIIDRQTDPDALKWLDKRIQGKLARFRFTDVLKSHGIDKGWQYAKCTDEINKPILGKTAKEMKTELGLENSDLLRDNLSHTQLAALSLAESLATDKIKDENRNGFVPCLDACTDSGKRVSRVFE